MLKRGGHSRRARPDLSAIKEKQKVLGERETLPTYSCLRVVVQLLLDRRDALSSLLRNAKEKCVTSWNVSTKEK